MMKIKCLISALGFAMIFASAVHADNKIVWDSSVDAPGIYFHWYEPSFYTGFAPRVQDPTRAHIRLSRGNQVRVTLVLSDADVESYIPSLLKREDIYKELVERKVIELSTNYSFDRFTDRLQKLQVREAPGTSKERALSIMKELNPGRVFEVQFTLTDLVKNWKTFLEKRAITPQSSTGLKLDAANALLPGRLNVYELSVSQEEKLNALIQASGGGGASELAKDFGALISELSSGAYLSNKGEIRAIEFTAIYPAGTMDAWIDYKGTKLPNFGVTGVWKLIPREKGKSQVGMVDYISTNPGYGFIIMLPYQHAGGIEYNVYHNAAVRLPMGETPFLPKEWRDVSGEREPKQNYQNLWAVGRGPVSRGCTRLGSGHMVEMRHLLPSDSDKLKGIGNFRSLPQCFDIFDIDGDGSEEAMGVQYYYAYRTTKERKPWYAYAPNERRAFYEWLYGNNVSYDETDRAFLKDVPVCRFGIRKAEEAAVVHQVPLFEAGYEQERLQFYKTKAFGFDTSQAFALTRELARVSATHQVNRAVLRLQ